MAEIAEMLINKRFGVLTVRGWEVKTPIEEAVVMCKESYVTGKESCVTPSEAFVPASLTLTLSVKSYQRPRRNSTLTMRSKHFTGIS